MKSAESTMKSFTKAFLTGGGLLMGYALLSLLWDHQNFYPFWGEPSLQTFFIGFSLWIMFIALLTEYISKMIKRRCKRDDQAPFTIWQGLSPSSLRYLALAVFCIFSTMGPLNIFMEFGFREITLLRVLYSAIFSGLFSATIILSGRKPAYLVVMIILFAFSTIFEDSILEYISGKPVHYETVQGQQMSISSSDFHKLANEHRYLGMFTIVLIVGGYIIFIYVISSEGRKRVQFETEIHVARKIQQELLPKQIFTQGRLSISGATIPAKEVGGDYYDCFHLSDSEHLIVLADASGHGVGAGILSAMMKSSLAGFLEETSDLSELFEKINRTMCKITAKSQFITAGALKINTVEHTAEIITVGHHPVLQNTVDGVKRHRTPSLALGLNKTASYQSITTPYRDGDTFVIFSDGITESKSANGEMFAIERLSEVIQHAAEETETDISKAILEKVKEFAQGETAKDDMTVISLRT